MQIDKKSVHTITNENGEKLTLSSKELVELRHALSKPEFDFNPMPEVENNWMILALKGFKITAIKTLQAKRNLRLKLAKDTVEIFIKMVPQVEDEAVEIADIGAKEKRIVW
jgi:ribosomal protein L7/L12